MADPDSGGEQSAGGGKIDHVARVGLVAYGLVHLLVAGLVVRLATGDTTGSASGSGAMHTLAQSGLGRVLLLAVAVGFAALSVWQAIEVVNGYHRLGIVEKLSNRLVSAVKVVVFAIVSADAVLLATGVGGGSGGTTDGYTARVMSWPAGPLLIGLVGGVIIVIGLVLAYVGLARNFREWMTRQGLTGRLGKAYVVLGVVGYVSRGIAIGLVGTLFVYAALTHDPDKSGGLDQALQDVLSQPFGSPALWLMAAGLGCYGLFCFAWARHIDR